MPSWDPEVTGKDSSGNTITIQKCTNWDGGNANSCNQPPKTAVKWIKCGLGSSPGGLSPWDKATVCSPYTDNFNCMWGQNCYAVTSFTPAPLSSTTPSGATTIPSGSSATTLPSGSGSSATTLPSGTTTLPSGTTTPKPKPKLLGNWQPFDDIILYIIIVVITLLSISSSLSSVGGTLLMTTNK
jgi:hypothetical protein